MDDLNLIGRRGGDSIYGLFNRTRTRNGTALLEVMFRYPLSDMTAINNRSGIFQYFARSGTTFPFAPELFDAAEYYLSVTDERARMSPEHQGMTSRLTEMIAADAEYKNLQKGLMALIELLQGLDAFLRIHMDRATEAAGQTPPVALGWSGAQTLLSEEGLRPLLKEELKGKLPRDRMAAYDSYLRFRNRRSVQQLLQYIYDLDVYIAVAGVAAERDFCFPRALAREKGVVRLHEAYHPLVQNAVANTLNITPKNHVFFLTGANMAGKSTFMKTLGISIFLAHMGFPVPALLMDFAVLDGMYTTINLPDDLGMGVSHFYAEVLRAKKIARELSVGKNLFVIFDELFRGTNVKDAGEATIAITSAFTGWHRSIFMISTHIIEAGEILKERHEEISFIYLPTRVEVGSPVYTYKIGQGITADRHGMMIVRNEGIFDILARDARPAGRDKNSKFIADQQTLDDLNLTGKYRSGSMYSLFNKVVSRAAERLLDEMFRDPYTDADAINRRSAAFLYLQQKAVPFPFSRQQLTLVEDYLAAGTPGNRLMTTAGIVRRLVMATVAKEERYALIQQGVQTTMTFLKFTRKFFDCYDAEEDGNPLREELLAVKTILSDPRLAALPDKSLSWWETARYHQLFGHDMQDDLNRVFSILCYFDLGIAVSSVARNKGFSYARALPATSNTFHAVELRHPALNDAVGNSLTLSGDANVLFLTGANMAGKSTLMKSFGIAVYLAHMGFPVAAAEMVFSVKEGLYSSINVPDDLSLGYSHFYAEVQRVKRAAEEVSSGKDLVVIFDELFKGTNVKDAYDATLAVTEAFAAYRNCAFVISTHIIEVGEELKQRCGQVQFSFLPTVMEGPKPSYTYRLAEGITRDRQGMTIIQNEGILEMLSVKTQTE